MVCPYRHLSEFDALAADELTELAVFTQAAVRALTAVYHPAGFNLGLNQGAVAGAGIAAHLHQHVVPRWRGDANFMPVIAETTVLPEMLADTRDRVAAAWPAGVGTVREPGAPGPER
jgi:ATP adenylyltransferase